ncbi:BC1872 family protein [Paenibacillus xylanexedens]|uniref:Phage ABA sandwich domain-containing protein n=1 Tax=Paenibacillus xylanexedens TaxID=528191 RepID=A0ABS4RQY5_PAEXY|nr:hypothetical protein [Paenibacillus xylanexedens]MBP2245305.1 hypothetical protein [Paenibacillus xylanexedens]
MTQTALTREQVQFEPVGKQLDAWVAKHVMFPGHTNPIEHIKTWCKNYSSDMTDAWDIIASCGHYAAVETNHSGGYICTVLGYSAHALTAPEAICKAALFDALDL